VCSSDAAHNLKETTMPNVVKHRFAPELTRKTEVTALGADQAAREKRAALRKWLKGTKRGRNAERAMRLRFDAAKVRYLRALLDFTHAAAVRNRDTGGTFVLAEATSEVRETTALALEAANAKLFGDYETTAAKAAKYQGVAAFMAAEAPAYEKISEVY
jgi:hypothetical protein